VKRPWWHHLLFGWRLLDGWLIALVLILMAAVLLFACTPPPPPPLHGTAALDAWVASHVTTLHEHPSWLPAQTCGFYNWQVKVIYQDDACMVAHSYGNPAFVQFQIRHEQGHALDHQVFGGARGSLDCNGFTCRTWEETANCVAQIVSGVVFATDLAHGYWECSASEVERIRGLMIQAGAW
jgi:hypothetical protein